MAEQNTYPLVSIITINYKDTAVTVDLLKSLSFITYPNYEIIVVDNGSAYYPKELIDQFPDIALIISAENRGFAGGNNLGLAQSKGELLLFINNDTEVEKGFLEPLVDAFQKADNIGLICPKICFHLDKQLIQYAGFTDLNLFTLRNKTLGTGEKDNGQHDFAGETSFPHGAAMMTSKQMIKECGSMSEEFFLYYEEMDWAIRMRKAGYKIWYEPKSKIYHKESISTGKDSPLKAYYLNRNRIIYLRKHFVGIKKIAGLFYHILIALPKNGFLYLIKFQFANFRSLLKAYLWHLNNSIRK